MRLEGREEGINVIAFQIFQASEMGSGRDTIEGGSRNSMLSPYCRDADTIIHTTYSLTHIVTTQSHIRKHTRTHH